MKNFKKGWLTTLLGVAIMILCTLDFFGFVEMPHPDGITQTTRIMIGFAVGFVLFFSPQTKLEDAANKILTKKTE